MRVLEKILREIEKESYSTNTDYGHSVVVNMDSVAKIIRSHMEDDGWIPVEEGLPDKYTEVLVSFEDGFNGVVAWYSNIDKTWWNANTERPIEAKVIAWRPLPAPYQPKEEKR